MVFSSTIWRRVVITPSFPGLDAPAYEALGLRDQDGAKAHQSRHEETAGCRPRQDVQPLITQTGATKLGFPQ
jgi:hypothetical protein